MDIYGYEQKPFDGMHHRKIAENFNHQFKQGYT